MTLLPIGLDKQSDVESPEPVHGSLVISIVNWQQADLTIDCLRSVAPEIKLLPDAQVVVVDNGSRDDSVAQLRTAIEENGWQDWATLVRAPGNHGFAAGNNVALRWARQHGRWPDFMLLLNSDTIVHPGAIGRLMKFMQNTPSAGIAGGLNEEPDGEPQQSQFRFHGLRTEICSALKLGFLDRLLNLRPATTRKTPARPVDWVCGAFMMIRSEVFDSIGLLDEGYFLYYEETDFTLRARRAGWSCWLVPDSRIIHLCGKSSGVTWGEAAPKRWPTYLFESRHRYYVKNHGALFTALVDSCAIASFALWRVRRALQNKPDTDPPHYLRDLIRHSVFVRGLRLESPETARPGGTQEPAQITSPAPPVEGQVSSNQA